VLGTEDVRLDTLARVSFEQREMLVRGRVEHDLRPEVLDHMLDPLAVTDVGQDQIVAVQEGSPVELELQATNQRGEVTTPGHATLLLPSREHGPVRLPDPPGGATDLQGALDAIAREWR